MPDAFICTQRHQRVERSSPPLHVPYSLQHFYSYSTRQNSLVGSTNACKRRHTEQPPTSCVIRLQTDTATKHQAKRKKITANLHVLYVTVMSLELNLILSFAH